MTTPAGTLAELAKVLLLFRDKPEAREEQRAAFKRLAEGLTEEDHQLKLTLTGFLWDHVAIPADPGPTAQLYSHLRSHGLGQIDLPRGLMSSTLLSFMRLVAEPPGTYGSFDHLVARLDAAGCGVIRVFPPPPAQ